MTDANTEFMGFEAGEDLTAGDIVTLNTDHEVIKCAAVEATNAIGIVHGDVSEGEQANIVVKGLTEVRVLVEDTDGSSGYDAPIVRGDQLIISGKAAGTYTVGLCLSAVGGTAQTTSVEGMVVGKALGAVAGVTTGDTYTTISAMVDFMS